MTLSDNQKKLKTIKNIATLIYVLKFIFSIKHAQAK